MEVTSTAPRRGRIIPSRYMDATAASRAAATSVSAGRRNPTATTQEKASKNSASVRRMTKSNATESTSSSKNLAPPGALAAKQRTVSSNTSGSRAVSAVLRKPSVPPVQTTLGDSATTASELDIASQLYAWIFMRHTLIESSNISITEFQENFTARVNELEAEENVFEETRVRYFTEREMQLLDDLSPQHLCRVVPALIRTFVLSQKRCQVAIANAAQLQGTDWETSRAVQLNMRDLDQLTGVSKELRKSTAALLCTLPPDSLLASTLDGLLPVLDMRLENLALSGKLLTTIRENAKNFEHLDSLRVLVENSGNDPHIEMHP